MTYRGFYDFGANDPDDGQEGGIRMTERMKHNGNPLGNCKTCGGTGKVHSHNPECWTCDGTGWDPPRHSNSLMVHVPDATRGDLIAALATMPDEAFGWFVLACPISAMTKGGHAQIWPDGMGGFSSESRASVEAVRTAADAYVSQKR